MKRISTFFLFLFFSIIVKSQEPVKNNNAIVVKGVIFSKVKETLLDAGFFIDQQNAEDGTIITKQKGFCECPNKDFYQLIYYIRVKDSVATIRGKFSSAVQLNLLNNHKNTDDKDDFSEVLYWKDKKSSYHYLFGIMTEFSKSLMGSSIEFKTL
ncbi:hypothetical protein CAP36_14540 [Chitinophagaceae bacterium IBVUCB2]|nr:hypothetical protein CAP36_14540 [Chitinophagaceae bacterium IBVUCB2]